MPCIFDIKPEDRHCQYCTATICDERQPKSVETFVTNKIDNMTNEDKKLKIADILLEFYEEYNGNMPNRPVIPSIYADKISDSLKEEFVSEDLGDYINELSKQFPEVSFAKLSRIAVRVAKWQKEKEYTCYEEAFEDGAKWKVENLWKPADGDDLPEIDREVIALLDNGKVVFAHRPNPEGWDAVSIITEKIEHYIPKTYDKGGWNIPDVKWWLDYNMDSIFKRNNENNKIDKR